MWIRPTHYTMTATSPKSWIVEGSIDGSNWTEIDRRTDNADFKKSTNTASFPISNPVDCRFIRLSQTDRNHKGKYCMGELYLVEFFGTLSGTFEHPASDRAADSPKQPKSLNRVEVPMVRAKSLDGILSYLTTKHGGHVHEKGIVTITSKSFLGDDPLHLAKNAADFTYDWGFCSKDEPGQWICWDFGEMGIRPTHYTMKSYSLKSWIVEGSIDGSNWTEIDRQTDNEDFNGYKETASFPISNPVDCRFI
jgi:hypothetical protein